MRVNSTYTLSLNLSRNGKYATGQSPKRPSLLVDSAVLIPSIASIPAFKTSSLKDPRQSVLEQFVGHRCLKYRLSALQQDQLPSTCRQSIFSLSAAVYNGTLACDCDVIGSHGADCDPFGGQCPCKMNVIGRRCDRCAPGSFGLGNDGCILCGCDEYGSLSASCDVDGQCQCRQGTHGRRCNQCLPGHYNFPWCEPCQCHGLADLCEDKTGHCINCRNNTVGYHCERCASGYIGDPTSLLPEDACIPCMCPGGPHSSIQHADSCFIDSQQTMICDCHLGYIGNSCDQCAINHFGRPLLPGGSCSPCECNGNIDVNDPESCNPTTGECLRCLHHTVGASCEWCESGFYGNAAQHRCRPCLCNAAGTARMESGAMHPCDTFTGQCVCLPGVTGQLCDRCHTGYWSLSAGTGCQPCDCDVTGSLSTECNKHNGQCKCIEGRGGRQCRDCTDIYWGNPEVQCLRCQCNIEGSVSEQCDRQTGHCRCRDNVAGINCDRCAAGTTGIVPHCVPCGPCFDAWNNTITVDLNGEIKRLMAKRHQLLTMGVSSGLNRHLGPIETNLNLISALIDAAKTTDLNPLFIQLSSVRNNLTLVDRAVSGIDTHHSAVIEMERRVQNYSQRLQHVTDLGDELKMNAILIKESSAIGAFNSTATSFHRSLNAQRKVDKLISIVDSELARHTVADLLNEHLAVYNNDISVNARKLGALPSTIAAIEYYPLIVNLQVCGRSVTGCDPICGGATCTTCGGPWSCQFGAVTASSMALNITHLAEQSLADKSQEASQLRSQMDRAKAYCDLSLGVAAAAFEATSTAVESPKDHTQQIADVLHDVTELVKVGTQTSEDTQQVVNSIISMSLSAIPAQVQLVARDIGGVQYNRRLADRVINDTSRSINTIKNLLPRADDMRLQSMKVNEVARRISETLNSLQADGSIVQKLEALDREVDALLQELSSLPRNHTFHSQLVLRLGASRRRLKSVVETFAENRLKIEYAKNVTASTNKQLLKTELSLKRLENRVLELPKNMSSAPISAAAQLQKQLQRADKTLNTTIELITRSNQLRSRLSAQFALLGDLSTQAEVLMTKLAQYVIDINSVHQISRSC